MLIFLDISDNNGPVNFNAIKASGADGVICKLCDGGEEIDKLAAQNWHGIKDAGLIRGCYHFVEPGSTDSPEFQAQHLLTVLGGDIQTGDIVAGDIEVGGGNLSPWALRYFGALEANINFLPFVYTYGWFANNYLTDPALAKYPLWGADYPNNPIDAPSAAYDWPAGFGPWPKMTIWQEEDTRGWPGVNGPVDRSYFAGTPQQFALLGKPGVVTPIVPVLPDHGKYKVTVKHGLRVTPRLSAPWKTLVGVGDILTATSAPTGLPERTTHWQYCETAGGSKGYAFVDNLIAV